MAGLTKVELGFSWGMRAKHYILPYADLYDTHQLPGIYMWCAVPTQVLDIEYIIGVLRHITMEATVTGKLRLAYKGTIRKQLAEVSQIPAGNLEYYQDALMCMSYPLYIGVSRNLNQRLSSHKGAFTDALNGRLGRSSNSDEEEQVDTDKESSYFGERLAEIWNCNISTDAIFVKYVISDKCLNCTQCSSAKGCFKELWPTIIQSETLMNSIFNPVFGRR